MDNLQKAYELKHRYQGIIDNLENNPGWIDLLKFLQEDIQGIDDNWHLLNPYDQKELSTLLDYKIHKLALEKLVNALDIFKAQINEADMAISRLEEEDE